MQAELRRMIASREAKSRDYAEKQMRGEMSAQAMIGAQAYIERMKELEEGQERPSKDSSGSSRINKMMSRVPGHFWWKPLKSSKPSKNIRKSGKRRLKKSSERKKRQISMSLLKPCTSAAAKTDAVRPNKNQPTRCPVVNVSVVGFIFLEK